MFSPAAAEDITLVAFGDSLTQGFGLPEAEGFVPQLETWLRNNGAAVDVINAGVSGDTTAGGRARIAWTLSGEVDAVLVELGANDMLRGLEPSDVRTNLEAILVAIDDAALPVLLAGVPAAGNYGPDYKAEFDAIFPDLAREYDAILYPNFFAGLGSETLTGAAALMQSDGIHPNAAGVARIVEDIGPHVLELIARAQE